MLVLVVCLVTFSKSGDEYLSEEYNAFFQSAELLNQQSGKTDVSSFSSQDQKDGTVLVSYRWQDPNSINYVGWKGDTATIEKSKYKYFSVSTLINRTRMDKAIQSFGFPESWRELQATSQYELEIKEKNVRDRAAKRGILITDYETRIDWKWIIEKSKIDLIPITKKLCKISSCEDYSSNRGLISVFSSFVQSIEYNIPASTRKLKKYRLVDTSGITMPLETLYVGKGDCDTKSILFASMIANLENQHVIFMEGQGHLFVGIRDVPRRGDYFVTIKGVDYVLIELTSPWPIGRIQQDTWRGCQKNLYSSIKVVG
jgi:hypothetical protein